MGEILPNLVTLSTIHIHVEKSSTDDDLNYLEICSKQLSYFLSIASVGFVLTSVTRLGDLLDNGQLFKAFDNN